MSKSKIVLQTELAKAWVFQQKPSTVGLTGLKWVLMGFMGQTGETQIP